MQNNPGGNQPPPNSQVPYSTSHPMNHPAYYGSMGGYQNPMQMPQYPTQHRGYPQGYQTPAYPPVPGSSNDPMGYPPMQPGAPGMQPGAPVMQPGAPAYPQGPPGQPWSNDFMRQGAMPLPQSQQTSAPASTQSSTPQQPSSVQPSAETANDQVYSNQHGSNNLSGQDPLSQQRFASELARDLTKFNMGELCILGKELATELTEKTAYLSAGLKKVMERKTFGPLEDPSKLFESCQAIMEKLVEIRLLVEAERGPKAKRISLDDYISYATVGSNDYAFNRDDMVVRNGRKMPKELAEKYDTFDENKAKLQKVSSELKFIEWMAACNNPAQLKTVDKSFKSLRD